MPWSWVRVLPLAATAVVISVAVSSGGRNGHRLNRGGNRRLNRTFHMIAVCQLRCEPLAQAYYAKKRAEGKTARSALRCLKRQLSDAVYRRLVRDAHPDTETGPEGHPGATTHSSAAGSTPTTGSSSQSLPGPASTDTTNPTRST